MDGGVLKYKVHSVDHQLSDLGAARKAVQSLWKPSQEIGSCSED